MKSLTTKITALFLLISTALFSQNVKISGVVKDSLSMEPIPFAHVAVGNTVTLTNLSGEFVITTGQIEDIELVVSYLGYQTHSESIDSLTPNLNIYLSQSRIIDSGISMSGDTIMDRVYRRFPINNVFTSQQLKTFYKEKMSGNDSLIYLAEGILDIYLPFDVSNESVKVSPIKARKKVLRPVENEGIALVKGHASDMVQSSIWREGSFLNEKNRKYYDFTFSGKKLQSDQDILIVEFEPKSNRGYINGKVYVDANTYAILKLEYFPDADKSRFWDDIKWVEEFDNFDGTYYLVRSSFEGTWWEGEMKFDFSALLVINEVMNVESAPEMGEELEEKDLFFEAASEDFTESFWEDYNFIKLNSNEKLSFSPKMVSGN